MLSRRGHRLSRFRKNKRRLRERLRQRIFFRDKVVPEVLKEWLDRVLSRGFASGPGGNQLAGKYWRSVITTGEPESAYRYELTRRQRR